MKNRYWFVMVISLWMISINCSAKELYWAQLGAAYLGSDNESYAPVIVLNFSDYSVGGYFDVNFSLGHTINEGEEPNGDKWKLGFGKAGFSLRSASKNYVKVGAGWMPYAFTNESNGRNESDDYYIELSASRYVDGYGNIELSFTKTDNFYLILLGLYY